MFSAPHCLSPNKLKRGKITSMIDHLPADSNDHAAVRWLTIATTLLNASHFAEFEQRALSILPLVLPRHQVALLHESPVPSSLDPMTIVRPLGEGEVWGWLSIRPTTLTDAEVEALAVIEHLLVVGYERVKRRVTQYRLRQRLQVEVEALRDSDDPDLLCRQLGQLLGELIDCPVNIGVVIPFRSSVWLELVVQYNARSEDAQRSHFWPMSTDLSGAVMKLGVSISSTDYPADCARYDVRPHPDYEATNTTPLYWVGVPIRATGKTLGVVYAWIMSELALHDDQRRLLDDAVYAAGYLLRPIVTGRLAVEVQQQREAWQSLVAAGQHVLNPDHALQEMLEMSCRLLEVDGGGLFIFDEQQYELVFRYAAGEHTQQLVGMRVSLHHSIIGQAFVTGKPVIVNDALNDPRRSYAIDRLTGLTCRNLMVVPYISPSGAPICLEYVNRRRGAPFIEHDLEQVAIIANLIGLLIDKRSQLTQVETVIMQRVRDIERLNTDLQSVLVLNRELLVEQPPDQLFRLIIDTIGRRMQFRSAALFVSRREHHIHQVLECVAATGALIGEFPLGTHVSANQLDVLVNEWSFGEHCVILNRRSQSFAVLFDRVRSSEPQLPDIGAAQWNDGDVLLVLLRAANRAVRAILLLDHPVKGQRPDVADLQALTVYASIAGTAIDMALLRNRQQQSLARLTALNSLGMVINTQSLPELQVLELTARGMIELVDALWAQIVLLDHRSDDLRLERSIGTASLEPDVVQTLARRALVKRRPAFRSATTVAVPLRGTQRMIGAIVIGGEQALDSADVEMLMLYATQAAVAVENMRLLEDVRRGRDHLAQVMAAVHDGLLLIAANGTIVIANEALYWLAHTAEWLPPLTNMNGELFTDLLNRWTDQRNLDPETVARLQRSFTVAGAHGELIGQDGVFAWTVTQAGDLVQDRVQTFLLTIRDVTAAKEAEQLRDDLTHMLIHDLRQPLTTITLAFERLIHELGDLFTERQRQAVQIGLNSTKRLLNLVNTMLDIGRIESGQMPLEREPFPIEQVIESVINPISIQAQLKGVQVVSRIDPAVRMLLADREIISRVLQNLLDNALKFSPEGGVITIEVGLKPTTGQPQRWTLSDELTVIVPGDRMAHISVHDQGSGIPLEDQQRIFDRFRQSGRHRGKGSGLGLTFCKLAIAAHQGMIWVDSTPDHGSTFHFTLPLAEIE